MGATKQGAESQSVCPPSLHPILIHREVERTQKILDDLSTYDHLRVLKQSRLKRHRTTSSWIPQTTEFQRWVDVGSGKTITTASVVDFILSENSSDCAVSLFFVESGNQKSLSANTIVRSLLRQRLDTTRVSEAILNDLEELNSSFDKVDEFVKLLGIMMPPPRISYIVIDGLDECGKPDRDRLLKALSSLIIPGGHIRLFLSSRKSLRAEIKKRFTSFDGISMDCSAARDDISIFVRDIIREKIDENELSIGDPELEEDLKLALIHGAQGMFLWVTFQVYEICLQHCDEDIRNALNNLPKDLTETYCRVLQRIESRGHGKVSQKIFPWIAATRQLLSLSQLREAIAIEIGRQHSKPERLYNDMNNIDSWCENLVHVDEEYDLVQFAHSTIKNFLIEEPYDSTLAEFHINLEGVDHDIGEKCITYLDFNVFKATVARRPKPLSLPNATLIAESALGSESAGASILSKLRHRLNSQTECVDLNSLRGFAGNDSYTAYQKLVNQYPFLSYASANWFEHTRNFQQGLSKTWTRWKDMIIYGHDLAKPLCGVEPFDVNGPFLKWAYHTRHYPLIRLISTSEELQVTLRYQVIRDSIDDNNVAALDIVLGQQNLGNVLDVALQAAARTGYFEVVEILLARGANANGAAPRYEGMTALQAAAQEAHLEVIERLLMSGADVNAPAAFSDGRTAIQVAAEMGHLQAVRRLLDAGADVNAPAARHGGTTALRAAAEGGYYEIIQLLLAAGADVNAVPETNKPATAVHAAAEMGHLKIVQRLIDAGADVNAPVHPAARHGCSTALRAAVEDGHYEIIRLLLSAGAHVNAYITPHNGGSALQAATKRGHFDVVQLLLAAGADERDAPDVIRLAAEEGYYELVDSFLTMDTGTKACIPRQLDHYEWRVVIHAAARRGHIKVVERILSGVDVSATPVGSYNRICRTAGHRKRPTLLQNAAKVGDIVVVEKLLAAGGYINATQVGRNEGLSALQTAARQGHTKVVDRLLLAGVDVDGTHVGYNQGKTALYLAAREGHIDVVHRLLAAGADVYGGKNNKGQTPVGAAALGGHILVMKRLSDAQGRAEPRF